MPQLYQAQLRHSFYYQQLLERLAKSYFQSGAVRKVALETVDAEWTNIETGHRWASENTDEIGTV
jgi:hypothetical protein